MAADILAVLKEGGLSVVEAILFSLLTTVLYFYRRDYLRALRTREQQLTDRTALVDKVLTLLAKTTQALEQNNALAERIARAVEQRQH